MRDCYGAANVIAAGHKRPASSELAQSGLYRPLDVLDADALNRVVEENNCDTIFHLAALLSAVAEEKPQQAWDINMNGLINVLETSRLRHCAVFFRSSIAAFGPGAPALDTPQDTRQRPTSLYGITKVSGELLCDYCYHRFGVDTRGLILQQ